MIISGGVNIYPAEIEAVLLGHPDVADVAVLGVPDDEWGEQVKAVIQAKDPARVGDAFAEELIAFCRERLAAFKCPRSVDFRERAGRLAATGPFAVFRCASGARGHVRAIRPRGSRPRGR